MSTTNLNTSHGLGEAAIRYLWEKINYGVPYATSRIIANIGIQEQKRPMLLKVLHYLKSIGILDSQGTGNIRWQFSRSYKQLPDGLEKALERFQANPMTSKSPAPSKDPSGDSGLLAKAVGDLLGQVVALKAQVEVLEKRGAGPSVITVKKFNRPDITLEDTLPSNFQDIVDLAVCRRNILMVGPSGCGKTTTASLLAKALGLDFDMLALSGGTNESHLMGRTIPNMQTGSSSYTRSGFIRCFSEGGVFLCDEMDAADPNVMLVLNSALANGYCSIPNYNDGKPIYQHKDFVMVAAANTFGKGATRVYAGRNTLDDATLDRFRIGTIECDYDERIEAAVCPDAELRGRLQSIRKKIDDAGLRRVMSTRFIKDAYLMSSHGWDFSKIANAYFAGWTSDERVKVS
jgi:cobaltochelatase CobS